MSDPAPLKPRHWVWWFMLPILIALGYLNLEKHRGGRGGGGSRGKFTESVELWGWPNYHAAQRITTVSDSRSNPLPIGSIRWEFQTNELILNVWFAVLMLSTSAFVLHLTSQRRWPRFKLHLSTLLALSLFAALLLWLNLRVINIEHYTDAQGWPWIAYQIPPLTRWYTDALVADATLAVWLLTVTAYLLEWRIARKTPNPKP